MYDSAKLIITVEKIQNLTWNITWPAAAPLLINTLNESAELQTSYELLWRYNVVQKYLKKLVQKWQCAGYCNFLQTSINNKFDTLHENGLS